MMDFLKHVEIAFRKSLLKALGLVLRRDRALDPGINFNNCKILFVRQDRIGDVLISTPLFAALKDRYPGASVDVLLSSNNFFALENDPLIRKRWMYRKNIISIVRLLAKLRAEHYDFVIDLMDNPSATSTLLLAFAGGRWNVGLEKDNSYVYDIPVPLLSRKETHIVDRLAELLRVFKIDPSTQRLHLRYAVSRHSAEFAEKFWRERGFQTKTTVGLNISAGGEVRFWGVDNFRRLISDVRKHYPDSPIMILFHPNDKSKACRIADGLSGVVLSPETHSFDEFAALIQRLSILVTPDTSAVHLAAAFQVPAVVLYVQSNKELRIWDPYNSPGETLVTDVDDLTTIQPEDVFAAMKRLFPLVKPDFRTKSQPVSVG